MHTQVNHIPNFVYKIFRQPWIVRLRCTRSFSQIPTNQSPINYENLSQFYMARMYTQRVYSARPLFWSISLKLREKIVDTLIYPISNDNHTH